MKKIHLCLLCMITLLCLSGCSNQKELEDKIKTLENKINNLEKKNNSITKEYLIGTWKTANGYTLTFKEDGTYTSTKQNNAYYAYELFGNGLITCVHGTNKIYSCFTIDEDKVEQLGLAQYHEYVIDDNKLIILDVNNMLYDVWTKIK